LDVILNGKALSASSALRAGLIDRIVPREYLVRCAAQVIIERGLSIKRSCIPIGTKLLNSRLGSQIIAATFKPIIRKRTRDHYPAVNLALNVVTRGITRPPPESLLLERNAVIELANTEATKNLLRIFFLQERSKKLLNEGGDSGRVEPVSRAAVIGAGVMGSGIAQWLSSREISVILGDISHDAVALGMVGISKLYRQAVSRGALSRTEARAGLDRVSPEAAEVPLSREQIVIEAAVERMDLKRSLFRKLDQLSSSQTILASNTSALSISELASGTKFPERVIGIHFFNPVHKMQLVEIVAGQQTSQVVVRQAVKFVQQIGKLPVLVKDSPGFLVNRILMPYLIEAGQLFVNGARIEDIDQAMLEFGMPMGPLRLIDEVGLEVCHHVASDLASQFSDYLRSPTVLSRMINEGMLGKKNGRGFYLHSSTGKDRVNPEADRFHQTPVSAKFSRSVLRDRMTFLMVNEAARCLEEGVVSDAADVDFGMIMGVGWAPFRGGPLRFADSMGAPTIVREMNRLASQGEPAFKPCNLLEKLAGEGRQFYPD
jgi:3-hydroxyacyl-CoA dehydrogenase / enoyl-CoA hydratase / 3-hydroxybutyryl-CoA epimerase